ncbi:MAG: isopeptide-forming domain-containing fimbrial protein [Coleofasciculaceae cyanobacterium RL_1_1]|nr:isopeptide-forming domain-containing fimbrial protein [Coleofasciculaceae cyanobacterium RL_1_1]
MIKTIAATNTTTEAEAEPTSELATTGSNVAIGEIVTYRLAVTIPEGTTKGLVVTDQIPDGMQFVPNSAKLVTNLPNADDFNGTINNTSNTVIANAGSLTPSGGTAAGEDVTFSFGDIVATGENDANPPNTTNKFYIEYQAIVLNVADNNNSDVLGGEGAGGDASLAYDDPNSSDPANTIQVLATGEPAINVVEPRLQIVKDVKVKYGITGEVTNPTTTTPIGDAGDPVAYEYTISHTTASAMAALDIKLTDTLPPGFTPDGTTPIELVDAAGTSIVLTDFSITGNVLTIGTNNVDLPLNTDFKIRVLGTLNNTVTPTTELNSTAVLTWSSIDGDNFAERARTGIGADDSERFGAPNTGTADLTDSIAPNTYLTTDDAPFTTIAPTVKDTLIQTEFANGTTGTPTPTVTNGNNVVIGEIVTYEVEVTVPEGTTPGSKITVDLPPGLAFYQFEGLTLSSGVTIPDRTGSDPDFATTLNSLISTNTANPVYVPTDRGEFALTLGSVVNTNTDNATPDTVKIRYQAIVLNIAANDQNDTFAPTPAFTYTAGATANTAATVSDTADNVVLQEPVVTIDKRAFVDPGTGYVENGVGDAGDQAYYEFTLTGSNAGGTASPVTAYDVTFADTIPSQFVGATISIESNTTGSTISSTDFTYNPTTGKIELTDASKLDIPPGTSIKVRLTGVLANSIAPGTFDSNAVATWSSIDGNNLTERDRFAAASQAGNSVTTDSERYGDPTADTTDAPTAGVAPNTYITSDNAPLTAAINSTIEKTILTTSEVGTGEAGTPDKIDGTGNIDDTAANPRPLAIGEIVTYRVAITLPDGTIGDVKISDVVPTGLKAIPNTGVLRTGDPGSKFVGTVKNADGSATIAADGTVPFTTTGTGIDFDFKSIEVDASTGVSDNLIWIEYQAIVEDVAAAAAGAALSGVPTLTFSGQVSAQTDATPPIAKIVEPILNIKQEIVSLNGNAFDETDVPSELNSTNSSNIPDGDAGDTVQLRLTITNDGTATANAYDLIATSTLDPTKFDLSSGAASITNVVITDTGTGATYKATPVVNTTTGEIRFEPTTANGSTFIAPGQTHTITFDVKLSDGVEPSEILVIPDAKVSGDSIAGNSTNRSSGGDLSRINDPALSDADSTDDTSDRDYTPTSKQLAIEIPKPSIAVQLTATEVNNGATDITNAAGATGASTANGAGLGNNVVIGEKVTYTITLTVPEGTLNSSAILEQLDPGLEFVEFKSIIFGNDVTSTTITDTTTLASNTTVDGDRGGFSINLGTIVNSGATNDGNKTVTITYDAIVRNILDNQAGDRLNNNEIDNDRDTNGANTTFNWNNGAAATTSAPDQADEVVIIEPELNISKAVSVNGVANGVGDAGDVVVYTITIDHTAASNADAYDVQLQDIFPAGFVPDATTPIAIGTGNTVTSVAASDFQIGASNTLQLNTGSATKLDIPQGQILVLTVTGKLSNMVGPGLTLDSDAQITWSSLDDEALTGDERDRLGNTTTTTDDSERFGASFDVAATDLNNYAAQADAAYTTTRDTASLIKTIQATDQADTSDVVGSETVAIGEVITYRLKVTLPEGTTNNLVVTDDLPPGLKLVGTPSIVLPNDNTQPDGIFNGTIRNDAGTIIASGNGVTPTVTAPPSYSPTVNAGGDTLTFEFDQVVIEGEPTGNNGNDFFWIEYTAVVVNDRDASDAYINDAGDTLTSVAQMVFDDPNNPGTAGAAIEAVDEPKVTVVEPDLSIVQSLELNSSTFDQNSDPNDANDRPDGDAGDTVSFTLSVTNADTTANPNAANAYDLTISEVLDPKKFDLLDAAGNPDPTKLTNITVPAGYSATPILTKLADGTVQIDFVANSGTSIAPGVTQAFSFDVKLTDAVEPGEILTGKAFIDEADSIPGTPSSLSQTQREYAEITTTPQGETNSLVPDNIPANNTFLDIPGPSIAVELVSTEVNNNSTLAPAETTTSTNGNNVVIGEKATYKITLTLPEGTFNAAQILENLDPGLAFVGLTDFQVTSGTAGDVTILKADNTTQAIDLSLINSSLLEVEPGGTGFAIDFSNLGTLVNSGGTNNAGTVIELTYERSFVTSRTTRRANG